MRKNTPHIFCCLKTKSDITFSDHLKNSLNSHTHTNNDLTQLVKMIPSFLGKFIKK